MDPGEPALLFRAVPADVRPSAEEKRQLKAFAAALTGTVASGRPFTCLITNDKEIRKLNNGFLGHDYPTDVLSFPSTDTQELGDLAISAERAQAQAEALGHSRTDEYRVLMLHGVLHLLGYDHEQDRGEMKRAEQKWRTRFDLPATLISRANGGARK